MHKTRYPGFIYDHLCGHAPELEQVDFLTVELEHAGLGVRQADEGQIVLAEIGLEGLGVFRPHHNDLGLPAGKFLVVLAQLRPMLLAEGSSESAVEHQQDIGLSFKIRKLDSLSLKICQGKIGCGGVEGYFGHLCLPI